MQFALSKWYMPQTPRNQIIYDDSFFHVTWQCHNKEWVLKDERFKKLYYEILLRYRKKYAMTFYSYHFMENHIHLIGKTESVESFSRFFQVSHNVFARQVNHRRRRRGQVVMERLKSSTIQDDIHMLTVMAYVDLNGVRAGRDKKPCETIWSSYPYYAYGKKDDLIVPAPSYLALAESPLKRQLEYRTMVEKMIIVSATAL